MKSSGLILIFVYTLVTVRHVFGLMGFLKSFLIYLLFSGVEVEIGNVANNFKRKIIYIFGKIWELQSIFILRNSRIWMKTQLYGYSTVRASQSFSSQCVLEPVVLFPPPV